jgi:hypothetical protein
MIAGVQARKRRGIVRRRPATGRPPGRRRGGEGLKIAAAIAVPLAVTIALVALGASGGGPKSPASSTTTTRRPLSEEATAWLQRLDDAFRPVADRLPELVQSAQSWAAGTTPPDRFGEDLRRIAPEFVKARNAVAAVPPLKEAPLARDLFAASARLYVEYAEVYLGAVEPGAEGLKDQADLIARRLRVLGDRIYDRARHQVDPSRDEPPTGDVEVRLAEEVPDWAAEGLAAGPPLADPPPPPPAAPPEREVRRPTQSEKKWLDQVRRRTEIPSVAGLGDAIRAGDPAALRSLADRFSAVSVALKKVPDPPKGRDRAAVVRLRLLVYGEAARVAQAAVVVGSPAAGTRWAGSARRLAVIADGLADPDLAGPTSGFPASLLDAPV